MPDRSEWDTPFSSAAATHVGLVRERNEDSMIALPEVGLWAVADGMGGHQAGAYASACVTDALAKIEPAPDVEALARAGRERIVEANAQIFAFSRKVAGGVAGATVAALFAADRRVACLWCGDSRIYRVRDGAIEQLTHDHTELQEYIDRGALAREEADHWPNRNVLTRAIGVAETPQLDAAFGDLRPDDTFVVCSDGLTIHVSDAEIQSALRGRAARAGCDHLVELALSRGGKDNVSVIVVQFKPDATRPSPGRRAVRQASS
ncbi:protein phosphatase 2C domain-containing protein [Rhodoblastus acidophilus]|uniref:Protein phosphatase 2C domain-containing protein n=1 Tax=Candidatus Rhodoblastus alkanivorans TaxID=2954117 RepID=A0ABS9ZA84_9HYPH|nr:protein phosphatase 2C domain-containing protein [Candidatus Rhodoblastus alkanivorans]MCI4678284.1 protein phosphatase 2C domain-containing protein [Candidatus Rhodoblastus alkanivorans]MCI4683542.1 protein phosphatase 2C domain-containing protein [Candidatus Rhodoblastus alkanivorans]MDI4640857.1 protein phosphatase 2C domain-containing protein [Rhodoblastus acidophilus]